MKKKKSDSCNCDTYYVNKKSVDKVKKSMKDHSIIVKLAETFKVLGDPTRTKIVYALSKEELCVCDLTSIMGISQSGVSHQLRVLRNMDLVKYRREGRVAFYSLNDEHIANLLDEGLEHVEEKK